MRLHALVPAIEFVIRSAFIRAQTCEFICRFILLRRDRSARRCGRFSTEGILQEGDLALKLWEGVEGSGVDNATNGRTISEVVRLEELTLKQQSKDIREVPVFFCQLI